MPDTTIKDHRSLFRQLLTGMYDAVLITDPNGHMLTVNARAVEFFQYRESEVLDSPVSRFIPGISPEIVQKIRSGLAQSRHMAMEANCQRKDGSVFSAEVTVSLIDLMDPGDLVFTIRSAERGRQQLESLRTKQNAAEISQSALFACCPDGRFRWVNQAFLDLFGYEDEEAAQKLAFPDVMDDEQMPERFRQALSGVATTTRITAETDEGSGGDVEIQLGPDTRGKRTVGVVGSISRA